MSESGRTETGTGALPRRPLVLVTGSSGLIGARVCAALEAEYDVVGLDRDPPEEDCGRAWVQIDLTDERSLVDALEGLRSQGRAEVASVVHLAAYYDFSGEPSPLYDELTVQGTRHLLHALRAFERVEQFVYSSSLLVMKPVEPGEEVHEDSPVEAEWDYPLSKLRAERVIRREHGPIPFVVLRIAGVYDEDTHSIPLAQQMRRIYEHRLESHFFPGKKSHGQSFVHLDDVASCIRSVVDRRSELGPQEMFLVGEPDVVSYDEVQDAIAHEIHGHGWTTLRVPAPLAKMGAWIKDKLPGQDPFIKPWMIDLADAHLPASIRHASDVLHWKPRKRLRETLPEMARRLVADPAAWYRENGMEVPPRIARRSGDGRRSRP